MQANNALLIRWDNTPHLHENISTIPDHKHVETDQNVQESEPMDLLKVLKYISQVIGAVIFLMTIWYYW